MRIAENRCPSWTNNKPYGYNIKNLTQPVYIKGKKRRDFRVGL